MQSHTAVNSPTRRGLFVQEHLLCNEIPTPPGEVEVAPIDPQPGQTLREALGQHVNDPTCATCHGLMDPVGFAFEYYDPTGAYQATDNGQPVDATGDLAGVGSFTNAAELMDLLAADPRVPRCLVDRVVTGRLGYTPNVGFAYALDEVNDAFVAADHRFQTLLVELVVSPAFRSVSEPQ